MKKDDKRKVLCITPIENISGISELLSDIGDLTVIPDPTPDQVCQVAHQYDYIFTNPNKSRVYLDEKVLGNASRLKAICTASTGLNHIDRDWATLNDIEVISITKEYHVIERISSTAELAFGLMLCGLRNIVTASNAVIEKGIWDYEAFVGRQVRDLKVAVIGYGRLGKMFAKFCKVFGAEIYVYDPYKDVDSDYIGVDSIHEVLPEMDVISLHVHVSEETKNMVGKNWFDNMKNSVVVVNSSRGEIIQESELVSFLEQNGNAKICTDVLSGEIHGIESSCLYQYAAKNTNQVLITPHVGGMTSDAQKIAYTHAANLLRKFDKNIREEYLGD